VLIDRILFKAFCFFGDRHIRRMNLPQGIESRVDLPYGEHGRWNLLDVYFPAGTSAPLPTIVNIHGGGYVYGNKELYRPYCMNLALRGFTVVNFNYRLVPAISFPMPVIETNEVLRWICDRSDGHFIDLANIFLVGDSAGAQIASQYATMLTSKSYADLFGLQLPAFGLRALALNCGMYEKFHEIETALPGLLHDYFGKDPLLHGDKVDIRKYLNADFPPTFIASSANDFLLPCARPMHDLIRERGVRCELRIYGTEAQKEIAHDFQLDPRSETAAECTDAQCDFFRQHIA